MALGQRYGERFRMRYKRLLIAALLILFVSCSVIAWNSHKSYSIENWQVVNHQQEFVPYGYLLKFKERADQLDDSKIYNIARYKASLINQARAMGIAQDNLATAFTTAGYIVYYSIYPVLIGMLLSVPGLYSNIRQEGRISLDWTRLGAVGIPALALTLSQILYWFTPIGRIIAPVLPGWGLVKDIVVVGGIILGYTLLSSIRKVPHTHEVSKTL
jgi:hypothetical protein